MAALPPGTDLGDTVGWKPPAAAPSYGEIWQANWDESLKASNFDAHLYNYSRAFDDIEARVKAATGETLASPFRDAGPLESAEALTTFSRQAVDGSMLYRRWLGEVERIAAAHPGKLDWAALREEPGRVAFQSMRKAREHAEEVSERAGLVNPRDMVGGKIPLVGPFLGVPQALAVNAVRHPGATATQLAASFAAQMTSPADAAVNVVSFGIGGAAKSLLRNSVQNAGSNMAGQMLLSAPKQLTYQSAGLPYGWQTWAEEVAAAGGAGFALDLGVRGAARTAIQTLGRDSPAGTYFSRNTPRGGVFLDAVTDAAPPTRPARLDIDPETIRKAVEDGDVAASREVLEKTGDIRNPAVRHLVEVVETTGRLDDEAIRALEAMGVARPDGMRMLADAMAGRGAGALPPPLPPAAARPRDPERGRALAAQIAGPGREAFLQLPRVHQQAIVDGLEAGAPRLLAAIEKALPGPPETLAARLAESLDDRLVAESMVHGGRIGPLDLAVMLRQQPDFIDASMPLDSQPVAVARDLARLDDEAFSMVAEGRVPPELGALVAARVPAEHQAPALSDIEQARPASIADATALIDKIMPPERQPAARPAAAPSTAEAAAKLEGLRGEAGRAYEEAMAPVRRQAEIDSEIESRRGEIAKLEEEARQEPEFRDPETGEPVSRDDVASVIEMWRYVQEMRNAKAPQSLIEFLRRRGGVNDEGGDVRHVIGSAGQSPGLINNRAGLSLDDATLVAWESGFLGTGERPDARVLIDAIDNDARGNRIYSERDSAAADDIRAAREMEVELDRYGIGRDVKSPADIERHFASGGREGAGGDPALARSEAIARLTGEIRALEEERAQLLSDAAPGRQLGQVAARAVDLARAQDVSRAVRSALTLGARILPPGTRVEMMPNDAMTVRAANGDQLALDGMSDPNTGHIRLAIGAVDLTATIGHEGVHTLVTLGHISPAEVDALAALAREAGTFKKAAQYEQVDVGGRRLVEEAAASYIEARLRGDVTGPPNTVVERIRQLLDRIRRLLAGYGFQSREDVVQALLSGEMARREARAEWSRQALEAGESPLFSIADEKRQIDVHAVARGRAVANLRRGIAVHVAKDVRQAGHAALAPLLHLVPADTSVGMLKKIVPSNPSTTGERVVTAHYEMPDGREISVRLTVDFIDETRAARVPGRIVSDGRDALVFHRFVSGEGDGAAAGKAAKTLRGELWHELTHQLRRIGLLRGDVWKRLVRHAHRLRVLDMEMGAYMRRIGYDEAPNAAGAAELSLAIAYRYVYQDLPDLKERLDQEAVAHMLELHANNQLLPHEIGPVEDIVKAIRDGRFSRQQQPLFSIGQSMRRDLDADGRPAPEPHDPRPIEADMAAVDRMNRMAELVGACRA